MFRTEAKKTSQGMYNVQSTCPKQHTSYRKANDKDAYKCPYCGLEVR